MIGKAALLASAFAITLCTPAGAVPGGEIGTLEKGRYICEVPSDDAGPTRIHVPSADFTVITASSYRVQGKAGSYLLTGDRVVMTSGPFKGKSYHRQSRGLLRLLDEAGNDSDLRCILTTRDSY